MIEKAKYILFATILSILTIAISNQLQPEISYNSGYGWDGVKYNKIAQDIAENKQISTDSPFIYRIGVPYLVAKIFPNDMKHGFLYLNWLFSILNSILLALLLARFINRKWVVYLLVFFYITQWHGYHRFGNFYPVQVDSLAILLIQSALLVLLKKGIKALDIILISIITLIGTFVREILIIPALLLIAKGFFYANSSIFLFFKFSTVSMVDERSGSTSSTNKEKNQFTEPAEVNDTQYSASTSSANKEKNQFTELVDVNKLLLILPLLIFIIIYSIVTLSVEPTNSHKFYNAAADMLYTKSLFRFFHSWVVAYGAILILPALYYKKSYAYLKQHKVMTTYLAIIIVFSYVGGADTGRIAFWGFPVVFIVTAKILEDFELNKTTRNFLYSLLLIQIISQRFFSIIPDYPSLCEKTVVLLTPIGNCFPYLNLFPAHSELIPAIIGFAEWSVIIFFLWIWKRKLTK